MSDASKSAVSNQRAEALMEKGAIAKITPILSALANEAAQEIIEKPDAINAYGGHIDHWKKVFAEFQETGDESKMARAFGYAVETLLTAKINNNGHGINDILKVLGCTIHMQSTQGGGTRVDYVLSDSNGKHIHWFDLTSAANAWHTLKKASRSVYADPKRATEIFYPKLDTDAFAVAQGTSIGERKKLQADLARQREKTEARRERAVKKLLGIIDGTEIPEKSVNNRAAKRELIRQQLYHQLGQLNVSVPAAYHDGSKLLPSVANSLIRCTTASPNSWGFDAESTTDTTGADHIIEALAAALDA